MVVCEEILPQRCQRQRAAREEHEGDFGHHAVARGYNLASVSQGSLPQKLPIRQAMVKADLFGR